MELVKGVPITEYCDQQPALPPRQRLELFVQVCQAVQHAHQKGIIHRDIKPSNVLVAMHDTTPVVKVIDFGVAKALGQELTDKTLFTGFAQMVGTPLYMSPEQAGQSALDIDTRSDIYSLGVLLYELLTGTTPFDKERFKKAAYDEIRRIIREEEPPKPSTRLSESKDSLPSISAQRHTEPAKLTKLVRGELDWIVMKALEKDRNRRYETANGFAARRRSATWPTSRCRRARRRPGIGCGSSCGGTRRRWRCAAHRRCSSWCCWAAASAGRCATGRPGRRRWPGRSSLILTEVDQLEREQKWPEALAAARRAEAVVAGGEADAATAQRVRERLKDLEFIDRLEQIRMQRATWTEGQLRLRRSGPGVCPGLPRLWSGRRRVGGRDVDRPAQSPPGTRHPPGGGTGRLGFRPTTGSQEGCRRLEAAGGRRARHRSRAAAGPAAVHLGQACLRDRRTNCAGWPSRSTFGRNTRRRSSVWPATLGQAKQSDAALRLLRDAQDVYPGDFWLNFDLAHAL